ncbi:MAG TPA: MerR family transcriptional regulator, partial [Acidimicrobiales bacterium]|nr:MerR family transcriptional regulator [Acidimicrobiales bacterium]
MEHRVDELAAVADVSVDTIRFYQSRGLLPAPRRAGRVAWYGDEHVRRLARIRDLQAKGFSLAAIRRFLDGDLDAADEALMTAVAGGDDDGPLLSIDELAAATGLPVALLQAVEREGLLIPRLVDGEPRYTPADAEVARAGLRLLEHGLPLADLLALARAHHAAVRDTAERAVALFDEHVREPLSRQGLDDADAAARLVAAFDEVLPATVTLVAH